MTQNGNAFHAFTDTSINYLADKQVLAYYQEEIPSLTDAWFDETVAHFMAATAEQRDAFQASLTHNQRSLFGIYGHRTATRAVRENSAELLLKGLVGASIANYVVPETRRVDVALAIYHHCARKLDLNPADLFAQAADYASAEFVPMLIAFGNRNDVILRRYGWQERTDVDGQVYYRFKMGS